jgi:hypothetical protein
MNFSLFYKDLVFHKKNERVTKIGSTHYLIETVGIQFPFPMSDPILDIGFGSRSIESICGQ